MDTNLRDEIERCLGDEPPLEHTDLVARGRGALRRRRFAEAVAMVAAAAVVVTGATLIGGSGPADSGPPVASTTAPDEPIPFSFVPDRNLAPGEVVRLRPDHEIHLRPTVDVEQLHLDPLESWLYRESVAMVYEQAGTTYWYVGYLETDGGTWEHVVRARAGTTFEDWLRTYLPRVPPPPITFSDDGGEVHVTVPDGEILDDVTVDLDGGEVQVVGPDGEILDGVTVEVR